MLSFTLEINEFTFFKEGGMIIEKLVKQGTLCPECSSLSKVRSSEESDNIMIIDCEKCQCSFVYELVDETDDVLGGVAVTEN